MPATDWATLDVRKDSGYAAYAERRNALVQKVVDELYEVVEVDAANAESEAESECDSPIEQLFLVAVNLKGSLLNRSKGLFARIPRVTCVGMKGNEWTIATAGDGKVINPSYVCQDFINPQCKIKNYRVDFLWTRITPIEPDRKLAIPLPQIIIECDGHDFHERTKEQASRDKERDRVLQSMGFVVLRFTGSDIWKDALACVDSVDATFDQFARRWIEANRPAEAKP